MTLNTALQTCLYQTMRRDSFTSFDARGNATYSTASRLAYQALQEEEQHIVVNREGREQLAKGLIYVGLSSSGATPSVDVRDRIFTPNSTASTPPILAVETNRDLDGVHHVVIHYGESR